MYLNWSQSFLWMLKEAHIWMKRVSNYNNYKYVINLNIFIYQTFFRDLPSMFIYNIINTFNKSEIIKQDTKNKLIIMIPWFASNTWCLYKLKQDINNEWYEIKTIDNIIFFHNIEKQKKKTIEDVLNIIKLNKNREIILFWYSFWWAIAEQIRIKKNIPRITYWTPVNPNIAPFWVGLTYYWKEISWKKRQINDESYIVNINEEFSFANPNPNWIIIKWQFSHFSINQEEVIKTIIDEINKIV